MSLSSAEKLILILLCDIADKLGVSDEIDPSFVRKAITESNTWALELKYLRAFESNEPSQAEVEAVMNILGMWDRIEFSYSRLPKTDQDRVQAESDPFDARFHGFDEKYETVHLSIARMLIEHMGLWHRFKDRDLNARVPTLPAHRRMLAALKLMSKPRPQAELTAAEIIELLNAQEAPV